MRRRPFMGWLCDWWGHDWYSPYPYTTMQICRRCDLQGWEVPVEP